MDMLERIERKAREDTPYILLDVDGKCKFEGKSYPEDVATFYIPILKWFKNYNEFGRKDLVIDIKMSYFNSSSSKVFIDIFERLEDYKNKSVTINWYYPENDEELHEAGEIYQGLTNLKFNYIAY